MSPRPRENPGPLEPFDERDTVFARTRLVPGSEHYTAYYQRHPERQNEDDRTRTLPSLASPGGRRYRPGPAALVESAFEASDLVAQAVEREARGATPEGLGADSTALATLNRLLRCGSARFPTEAPGIRRCANRTY